MRLLVTNNTAASEVVEIIYAAYEESVRIKIDNQEKIVSGFMFTCAEKEDWIIPNVSINECNSICNQLLQNGYSDVSRYGDYYEIKEIL